MRADGSLGRASLLEMLSRLIAAGHPIGVVYVLGGLARRRRRLRPRPGAQLHVIAADAFLDPARARGFGFYAGVPCSFLTPIINRVIGDPALEYVGATSEGEAVAIAAGAWLAGRKTVVMCQNSGLGNAVNPLTSLSFPFRIPTLLVVTWRGQPGIHDEPQHELMGQITGQPAGRRCGSRTAPFPETATPWSRRSTRPRRAMDALGAAVRLHHGEGRPSGTTASTRSRPMRQAPRRRGGTSGSTARARPASRCWSGFSPSSPTTAAVIATTGKCGRELFTLADRPQHLYQVGSMGGASAMGLGRRPQHARGRWSSSTATAPP